MTTLTEALHPFEFLHSQANGSRSLENITVMDGQNLKAGDVLGLVATGAATSAAKAGGNTGTGTMGAVTVGAAAKVGAYVLTITAAAANAGTFSVVDPDGVALASGTVAVAYSQGGLSFTLADGATDFIVGDGFVITVASVPGKHAIYNNAATNGTQAAVGILAYPTDATAGHTGAVMVARDAEVNAGQLGWNGQDGAAIAAGTADLAALGIIARATYP